RANAKRFALSGARIPAEEAHRLGAVDQIVGDDVIAAAVEFLKQFEGADRRGVAAFKRVVRELADNGREAAQRLERDVFAELWFPPARKRCRSVGSDRSIATQGCWNNSCRTRGGRSIALAA